MNSTRASYAGTPFRAAYDLSTHAVHGLGRTDEEAIADARRRGAEGPLSTGPCSGLAYAYVRLNGGAPSSRLDVSSAGVRLEDE